MYGKASATLSFPEAGPQPGEALVVNFLAGACGEIDQHESAGLYSKKNQKLSTWTAPWLVRQITWCVLRSSSSRWRYVVLWHRVCGAAGKLEWGRRTTGKSDADGLMGSHRLEGCGCQENHWLPFDANDLEELMVDLCNLPNHDPKQFALGELTACGYRSKLLKAPVLLQMDVQIFCSRVEVCRKVFKKWCGQFWSSHATVTSRRSASSSGSLKHAWWKRPLTNNSMPSEQIETTVKFIRAHAMVLKAFHTLPHVGSDPPAFRLPPVPRKVIYFTIFISTVLLTCAPCTS